MQTNARIREYFYQKAKELGLGIIFVMLNIKRAAIEMIPAFKTRRILVGRPIPSLPDYFCISLGIVEEMDCFFKVLEEFIT